MRNDTATPQKPAGAVADDAGIIRHARRLASELGPGDPAATLLALAAQNDRLVVRVAEAEARRDDALKAAQGVVEAAVAYQEARAGDYDDDVCEARAQEVCARVVAWREGR